MTEITILAKVNAKLLKGQVFNTHNEANIVWGIGMVIEKITEQNSVLNITA